MNLRPLGLSRPATVWGGASVLTGIAILIAAISYPKAGPLRQPSAEQRELVTRLRTDVARMKAESQSASAELKQLEAALLTLQSEKSRSEGRLEAKEAQLRSLETARDAKAAEASAQLEKIQGKAESELKEAIRAEHAIRSEAQAKEEYKQSVKQTLQVGQFAVVTVLNEDAEVGTGFYVHETGGALIVAPDSLVPAGKRLFVRVMQQRPDGIKETTTCPARALYRDKETGLAFLALAARIYPKAFDLAAAREAKPGDRVFALGVQVLGGKLLEHAAFDGTVSAIDRTFDRKPLLQLSLAANPGLIGAPVFDGYGQIIGVLWSDAPGMERTSFALPASDVVAALARCVPNLPTKAPPAKPEQEKAKDKSPVFSIEPQSTSLNTLEDPFVDCATIKLTYEQRQALRMHSLRPVFLGGDELLVIRCDGPISWTGFEVSSGKKCWELQFKSPMLRECLERGGAHVAYPSEGQLIEVDLKNGQPSSVFSLPSMPDFTDYCRWKDYWFLGGSGIRTFDTHSKLVATFGDPGASIRFLTIYDNHVYAVLNRACRRYPLDRFLPLMDQLAKTQEDIRKATPNSPAYQRSFEQSRALGRRIGELAQPVQGEMPEAASDPMRANSNILWWRIGSPWVVARAHPTPVLYRLSSDRVERMGAFGPLTFAQQNEPWFKQYYGRMTAAGNAGQLCDISTDGKYAITAGFLWELAPLRPVLGLPFPGQTAGFMPDGKHLYIYDEARCRIVFPSFEDVLKAGLPIKETNTQGR